MTVTETKEPQPFRYRLTVKADGQVGLDVGDDFNMDGIADLDGVMAQVGLDMIRKGAQFMGIPGDEAKMLCLLALKQADES